MNDKYKQRILLATIILIFLLFASYNIGVATVHYKYNRASNINNEINDVIKIVENNTEAVNKLNNINDEIEFINAFCFEKGDLE